MRGRANPTLESAGSDCCAGTLALWPLPAGCDLAATAAFESKNSPGCSVRPGVGL